ncbi:hypothetical protein C943_04521 [Mariniradius saccharolyticus AK6]|uniref:Uncharacterized protein n=1 Tax=Mariniradius saccharolyticus AK6 TaxID=1239962 RepID=M7XYS6_9BACT|nr:hypothetical protein C943_04521 [Mariniradius saccharolyticus AK6]
MPKINRLGTLFPRFRVRISPKNKVFPFAIVGTCLKRDLEDY